MSNPRPFVTITEQPAAKLQRFRYLSEVDGARSVGSIPGVNSTPDRKTYPTIRVHGHKGPFLVLLSLLNPVNDLVHPHAITGSDPRYQCRQGVIYVITEGPDVVFKNIGILCVKGKTENDVKTALKNRKLMNIDPFKAGFKHIEDHRLIDFTAVRICFQVFLPGPDWTPADLNDLHKYSWPLAPVASDVVYDAKKLNDLKIAYINGCAGPLTGGHEMTLLCEKYTGQNPDVVFEDEHGWTRTATVELYHKQLAIVFKTPPYREDRDPSNIDGYKVKVYLQQSTERGLQRSQPATLQYLPNDRKGNPLKLPTPPPPSYPANKLSKMRRKGMKPENSIPFPTPSSSTQVQPSSPYQNIKQSPSSFQVPSPVNNAELDYNIFNGEFNTISNSIQPLHSSNVVQQNNIAPIITHKHDTLNSKNANINLNITTPSTMTGVNNVQQGSNYNANSSAVHRFTARIPPGTKIKRPKPEQNHSGELLPKRDKIMQSDIKLEPMPSISFNVNDVFNVINGPVPYNGNIPAGDAYLPIEGENIVNPSDPVLWNTLPPDYLNVGDSTIPMSDYLDSIWPGIDSGEITKTVENIVQDAENWMLQIPNLNKNVSINNINVAQNNMSNVSQNIMPNVDQNLVFGRVVDRVDGESVSEELGRMFL